MRRSEACVCGKVSTQRRRQSGEGGWQPTMRLQRHFIHANGRKGWMLRHSSQIGSTAMKRVVLTPQGCLLQGHHLPSTPRVQMHLVCTSLKWELNPLGVAGNPGTISRERAGPGSHRGSWQSWDWNQGSRLETGVLTWHLARRGDTRHCHPSPLAMALISPALSLSPSPLPLLPASH